jgi:hypothetical protein
MKALKTKDSMEKSIRLALAALSLVCAASLLATGCGSYSNWAESLNPTTGSSSGLAYEIVDGSITITGVSTSEASVSIPSQIDGYTVVALGSSAFANNAVLGSITLPSTLTSIGDSAFSGCSSLVSITLGSTTPPSLGSDVFKGCSSLKYIYVPDAAYDSYLADSAWSAYKDYIVKASLASAKAISSFGFASPTASGTISGTTISVSVPYGTDRSSLVASFTSDGASVLVKATAQTSGTTANDFSSSVTYTVMARDGSTQDYQVSVTPLGSSSLSLATSVSIVFSGQASTLSSGSTMTVTATTSLAVDSYAWYLDGSVISGATGSSISVGTGLATGPHSLGLVVKKDGILSSNTLYFTVQ